MSWRKRLKYTAQAALFFILTQYALGPSTVPLDDPIANIRAYTRSDEFNFVDWTLDAVKIKFNQAALSTTNYLDWETQRQIVYDYLALVEDIRRAENELSDIYTDPNLDDPEAQAAPVRQQLERLYQRRASLAPLAESVLQNMVAAVTDEMGFHFGGQPLPPVLYHATPLPWALIVSPRNAIQQDANISLQTELTLEDHIRLEDQIAENLDVSTLVVPVGGIGTYPTMVAQSTNLNWIVEVISHEWIHNYLTLRPLGLLYGQSHELRTMNETTASIAGTEIGRAVIAEFFPELVPPPPPDEAPQPAEPPSDPEPPAFDFRAEMRQTRVTVDQLLADGQIEEAEAYMEARRQVFWDNGYRIRKINQAYFAFYGAYADVPGGAAGEDPVGGAVRQLWGQSKSLVEFVNRIAWLTSFEALQEVVGPAPAE